MANLYKIEQSVNNDYDTYDSAVVVADNEDEARKMHPAGVEDGDLQLWYQRDIKYDSWATRLEQVKVTLIGEASSNMPKGVVVASFNAG